MKNCNKHKTIVSKKKQLECLLCKIFKLAYELTNTNDFLFSGGVALNSASVEVLAQLDFIKNITIPPSPGDSGAAIGASYYGYIKSNKK